MPARPHPAPARARGEEGLPAVAFEPLDAAGGVRVVNRHDFLPLSGFDLRWRLEADGGVVAEGTLPRLDIPARRRGDRPGAAAGDARARRGVLPDPERATATATPLVPAGFEDRVGAARVPGRRGRRARRDAASCRPRLAEAAAEAIGARAEFAIAFDTAPGRSARWTYRGAELLRVGPVPDFWRAPTDNDIGNRCRSGLAVWRTAGPDGAMASVAAHACRRRSSPSSSRRCCRPATRR